MNNTNPAGTDLRLDAVNELKKTSEAYKEWQKALQLRDRAYQEGHLRGSEVFDRILALIQTWHSRWQKEMEAVQIPVSMELLGEIERSEIRCDEWGASNGDR